MAILTLGEFKLWAVGNTQANPAKDPFMEECLSAAAEKIESFCRASFGTAQDVTDEAYDGHGSRLLALGRRPIISITAIKVKSAGGTEVLDLASPSLHVYKPEAHIINEDGWPEGYQNVLVSWKGGVEGAAAPASIRMACYLLAGHYWFGKGRDPAVGSESASQYSRTRMQALDKRTGLPTAVVALLGGQRGMLIASVQGKGELPYSDSALDRFDIE